MPELPEVETVCRGLEPQVVHQKVLRLKHISKKHLRKPIEKTLFKKLKNQTLLKVERRAKYLIFDFGDSVILNHLGMTGSWRKEKSSLRKKHDHISLYFEDGSALIYNDPRRFGLFQILSKNELAQSSFLSHLGVEPLERGFHSSYLLKKISSRKGAIKAAIKAVIMDQKVVVGVGNIYASEALFLSQIHPLTQASDLGEEEGQRLVAAIKKILRQAIRSGGSTIKDFKQAGGSEGYFQIKLKVYGKSGQKCVVCSDVIVQQVVAGRSTFWCPSCQS